VNQLVAHGWPYSPPEAGEPGWRFYASAVFNNHNPWWIVMPDITTYLQRMSWLLRQGKPVADVAVYLPTADAMANFALGRASVNQAMETMLPATLLPAILDAGYNFDFIGRWSHRQSRHHASRADRAGCRSHPARDLAEDRRVGREGWSRDLHGTHAVEGARPERSGRRRADSIAVGEVQTGRSGGSRVRAARGPARRCDLPAGVGFVHRTLPFAEVYFLANTTNQPVQGAAAFRVVGMEPSQWDPFTGKLTHADLTVSLAPYESRVFVFSKDKAPAASPSSTGATLDLSTGWTLTFPDAQPVKLDALHS